jgi:hypothetical protein
MQKENLLIIISSDNVDSIMKFPLLYGGVSLPRGYWKEVHIMFWGASIELLSTNEQIQSKVLLMQKDGVRFSSCIVCAEDYGVVATLEALGVSCNHTGELLTEALKSENWATLNI